ncbi:hypothetical protein EMCG_05124 [[Emmonsia] crescens]|uniref:Uncharacterized protein n=1 Tax=[Emmonsia] crescens TaxID=73230 RepID=A0A0G2HQ30_9EURO|nr:hypothetical protein EMCG_05124 [Emmonsia crescens UAMH 3008]
MTNTSFGKVPAIRIPLSRFLANETWMISFFNGVQITKKLVITRRNSIHASSRSNYINAIDTHPSKVPKRPALSRLSLQWHHAHKNKREELTKRSPRPRQHSASGTRAMANQNKWLTPPRLPTTPGQSAAADQRRQAPNPGQLA